MKDITVIVPVYNVYPFLSKCLDSLVKQKTNSQYEVICVDDGSTDNSLSILEEYKRKYPAIIRVISQENKGVSTARNVGILNSLSEFITFVDADDWVGEYFIADFLNSAKINKSDLVIQDTIYVNKNKQTYESEDIKHSVFNVENHVVNKMFRLSILKSNNIKFPTHISIGEDMYFTFLSIMMSKNISKVNSAHYYYRRDRKGSAMNSSRLKKYLEINKVCQLIYEKAKAFNVDSKNSTELEYLFFKNMVFRMIPKIIRAKHLHYSQKKILIKSQFDILESFYPYWYSNQMIVEDVNSYYKLKLGKNYLKQFERLKKGKILAFTFNYLLGK